MQKRQRTQIHVGQRFGRLTVQALRPAVFKCDCGQLVTNRMPYAVVHSNNPSCGCLRRSYTSKLRTASPNFVPIRILPGDEDRKAQFARWIVQCKRCHATLTVSNAQLCTPKKARYGCRACYLNRTPQWLDDEVRTQVHDHAPKTED